MSQFVGAEPLDSGDDLFDMDVNFAAKPAESTPEHEQTPEEHKEQLREEMKSNAFAAIEDKLGLPIGSTKEGIKAAKETTKAVTQSVQDLKSQYSIIETKEKLNETLPVPRYNIDTLAGDRNKLRELAFQNLGNTFSRYLFLIRNDPALPWALKALLFQGSIEGEALTRLALEAFGATAIK